MYKAKVHGNSIKKAEFLFWLKTLTAQSMDVVIQSHFSELYFDCDCVTILFCCDRDWPNWWRWPRRDTAVNWRPWRGESTHVTHLGHVVHTESAEGFAESVQSVPRDFGVTLSVFVSSEVKHLTFCKDNTSNIEWITSMCRSSNVLGWLMMFWMCVCYPKSPAGRWLSQDDYYPTGV